MKDPGVPETRHWQAQIDDLQERLDVRLDEDSVYRVYDEMHERALVAEAECERLRATVESGIEAFRLTRDYIGPGSLPQLKGWAWFDWCLAARAVLGEADGDE